MKNLYPKLQIIFFLALVSATNAQNPYGALGIETNVLTLTKGKYPEFIPNQQFMAIGSVLLNTITGEVVEFINLDTATFSFNPTTSTRFLSVDPIGKQYPELTPYQFASNRPKIV